MTNFLFFVTIINEPFIHKYGEKMETKNRKIKEIAEAATRLFLLQGYSKTQISHIANAVGVSVGSIYLYFTGKQEIMQFVLKSALEPDFSEHEFRKPITGALFNGLEGAIADRFKELAKEFSSRLGDDSYSFELLISDTFDLLFRYAVGCLFIEKNQFDFPFLADSYRVYRKEFFDTMKKYLNFFMDSGKIRALENPTLTATLIIETLSWWAIDSRYTSFELCPVSPDQAKRVCMDNIVTAYKN